MNLNFTPIHLGEPCDSLSVDDIPPFFRVTSSASSYGNPAPASSFHQEEKVTTDHDSIIPSELDIILGKGKIAFNHVGNKKYRAAIEKHGKRYKALTPRSGAKTRLTGEIIKSLWASGSRFLQMNEATGKYEEVEDVRVLHEKVSKALRVKPRKKTSVKARHRSSRQKLPTAQENKAFGFLYVKQQRVLQELLVKHAMEEAGAA